MRGHLGLPVSPPQLQVCRSWLILLFHVLQSSQQQAQIITSLILLELLPRKVGLNTTPIPLCLGKKKKSPNCLLAPVLQGNTQGNNLLSCKPCLELLLKIFFLSPLPRYVLYLAGTWRFGYRPCRVKVEIHLFDSWWQLNWILGQ